MLAAAMSAGCGPRTITVKDDKGAPISGAEVRPSSASINYPPVITNAQGIAVLSYSTPQKIEWIVVKAAGYPSSGEVPVGGSGNIYITIK